MRHLLTKAIPPVLAGLLAVSILGGCSLLENTGNTLHTVEALKDIAAATKDAICTNFDADHPLRVSIRDKLADLGQAVDLVVKAGYDPYCDDSPRPEVSGGAGRDETGRGS